MIIRLEGQLTGDGAMRTLVERTKHMCPKCKPASKTSMMLLQKLVLKERNL